MSHYELLFKQFLVGLTKCALMLPTQSLAPLLEFEVQESSSEFFLVLGSLIWLLTQKLKSPTLSLLDLVALNTVLID